MKILFFSDYFVPEIGAPAAHVYDRCKIWVDQGYDVTVITNFPNYPSGKTYDGYDNKFRSWENIENIKVLRVWTFMAENKGTFKRTIDYISYSITSFINAFFVEKPDVVISTSPHIFTPIGAIFYSIFRNIPHVVEIRDLWPESIAATTNVKKDSFIYKIFTYIENFIYKRANNIILLTNAFKKNLLKKGISNKKLHVVINGANINLFKRYKYDEKLAEDLGLNGKFVIAYFGTHGLAHNLLNSIHAAKIVENEDIHLLFIGEGAEKTSMINAVDKLKITNVHFIDRKPRTELAKYWSIADAGLVHLKNDPTFETVIPSKIFETMAIGLPIVYSGPQSEGADIIRETQSGLISIADSPQDLAKNFSMLKKDKELYIRLKNNSKSSSSIFSRDAQAKGTLEVLKKSIKNK